MATIPPETQLEEKDLTTQVVEVKREGTVADFFGVSDEHIQVAPPWTVTPAGTPEVVVVEEKTAPTEDTAEKNQVTYDLNEVEEKKIAEIMENRKNVEESLRGFLSIKGDAILTEKQNRLREFATVMAYGYIHGKPTIMELRNPASIDMPLINAEKAQKQIDALTAGEGFKNALEETKKRIINPNEKKSPELTEDEQKALAIQRRQILERSLELQNTKIGMQNEVNTEIIATIDKYTPEEGIKIIEEARNVILNTPLNKVLTVEAVRQYMVILKAAEEFNRTRKMHLDPFVIQTKDIDREKAAQKVNETVTDDILTKAAEARKRMNQPRPSETDTGNTGEEKDPYDFLAQVRNAKNRAGIKEPIITTEEQKGNKDEARIIRRDPIPTT
jgi:hypothetical protein